MRPSTPCLCPGEMVAQQGWHWPYQTARFPAAMSWADTTAGELAGHQVSLHGMVAGCLQSCQVVRQVGQGCFCFRGVGNREGKGIVVNA